MERPTWAPAEVDLDKPSVARIYDYLLGGYRNLAVDRDFADRAVTTLPELPSIMRMYRSFLRRTVRYLVDAGVRQFLDQGSGIPTAGNVHEIAQAAAPESRVVYVDSDPVAVAHSQVLLERDDRAAVLLADMRSPAAVLTSDVVTELLDFSQPIAVLMCAVLHFVESDVEVQAAVTGYRDALAPGSYLVISHIARELLDERGQQTVELYNQINSAATARTFSQFTRLFDRLELVEPGVVCLSQWRPDSPEDVDEHPERGVTYGAVGRTP